MLKKIIIVMISIPKTIFYNFKFFDLKKAIKLPLLVSYDTHIKANRSSFEIIGEAIKPFMIKVGITKGSFNLSEKRKTYLEVQDNAKLRFYGKTVISKGGYIYLSDNSLIEFGNNFSCNANCIISSQNSIIFGNDCLIGWNCTIIDGDGHTTDSNKNKSTVKIGNHVWIGAETKILKNSVIGNDSIIALGSIISGTFDENNILIASEKAKIKRRNVKWKV